jgi:dienelactone hydrolase
MRGRFGLGVLGWLTLVVTMAWAADDTVLRGRLETIMGPFPSAQRRGPLEVRVESVENLGAFERRRITYQSEAGSRVPAYLLIPQAALAPGVNRSFPAVLGLHQTHPAGSKVVVGLGQSPDDEYGVELARRGFVVLAPPYPWLAEYEPDLAGLGYASGTMKAIWDNSRGLDLLASLPYVATNRGFGCIGHSLGGHNGLFTAAFDSRISVVVTSCGFDSFRDYYDGNPAVWQPEKGWCQTRYMPRLLEYRGRLDQLPFDFPDVLTLISPRPVFISAPKGDSNFRWQSVDRVVEKARTQAEAAGRTPRLTVVHPDSPHRFPPEQREQAYRELEAVLRAVPASKP